MLRKEVFQRLYRYPSQSREEEVNEKGPPTKRVFFVQYSVKM